MDKREEAYRGARLVEARNRFGQTPLHFASLEGAVDVVRLPVEVGGKRVLRARNQAGESAGGYARNGMQEEVLRVLEEMGGCPEGDAEEEEKEERV